MTLGDADRDGRGTTGREEERGWCSRSEVYSNGVTGARTAVGRTGSFSFLSDEIFHRGEE